MDNPFNQFNPFSFLNSNSDQFKNPFNPFQAASGFNPSTGLQFPWMQNQNSYGSTAPFSDLQNQWFNMMSQNQNSMMNTAMQNQMLQNAGQMMNQSMLPLMNLSQDFISRLQKWQKEMQEVASINWQQNLMKVMLDASKQNASHISEQMGNLIADWKKYDLGKFINNPLFSDLQKAVNTGNLAEQRKVLEQICKQWIEYSKTLQRLDVIAYTDKTWVISSYKKVVDETLSTFEKMQSRHFDSEDQQNLKNYLAKLSQLFDGFLELIQNFSNFESDLSNQFIDAALSENVEIKDMTDLFNLWCKKFDECYNQKVLTQNYQNAFAKWVNAISDFKIAVQKIIDRLVEQAGLPSNREMNTVHRRLHQVFKDTAVLKKQISDLESQLKTLKTTAAKKENTKEASAPAVKAVAPKAEAKVAPKAPTAASIATSKAAPKKAPTKAIKATKTAK